MTEPNDDWLSIPEAARLHGVCQQTVHRWIKRDGLETKMKGRRHYINRTYLETWLGKSNHGVKNWKRKEVT